MGFWFTWNPSQRWWGGLCERLIKCEKSQENYWFFNVNVIWTEHAFDRSRRSLECSGKNYVYDDEQSISYPPTPSYTINGRRIESLTNSEHFQIIRTNNMLTKRARHKKKLLQQFTCIQWQKGYDGILREDAILKWRNSNNANISVGYIVIVKSDSTKRIFWKLAKVEELFPRKDGQICSARVKVTNSKRNLISVQRVIQPLIQLEVTLFEEIDELGHYEKSEEHRHKERERRCGWNYKQLYTTATKDSPVSSDCMLEQKRARVDC